MNMTLVRFPLAITLALVLSLPPAAASMADDNSSSSPDRFAAGASPSGLLNADGTLKLTRLNF